MLSVITGSVKTGGLVNLRLYDLLKAIGLLQLEAVIAAADLPVGEPLELGLTAVIEEIDGSHTYWALHHPEARPDFHHRAGFTLSLNRA